MEYRFISTKAHGVLDYVMGATLTTLPLMLDTNSKAAKVVPMALGGSALVYSLFTDYELGVSRALPMKAHLAIDAASGLFLAASPWIFKFNKKNDKTTWLPYVVLGAMEVMAALFTKTRAEGTGSVIRDFFTKDNLNKLMKKVMPGRKGEKARDTVDESAVAVGAV